MGAAAAGNLGGATLLSPFPPARPKPARSNFPLVPQSRREYSFRQDASAPNALQILPIPVTGILRPSLFRSPEILFVSKANLSLVTTNQTGGVEYIILAEKPIYYDRAATFTDLNRPYIWPRKIHGVSAFYMTWRGDIKSWDMDGGRPMDSR
jgi:hypothetical protein